MFDGSELSELYKIVVTIVLLTKQCWESPDECYDNYFKYFGQSTEMPKNSTKMPSSKCPNDMWIDISNSSSYCYHFPEHTTSLENAISYCESIDGTIVTKIDSNETDNALMENARNRSIKYFYLGTSFAPVDLSWSDGTPITYSNWASGQSGSEDCVKLEISSGQWFTTPCSDKLSLGCQNEKVLNSDTGKLECPDYFWKDLVPSSNYCYWIVSFKGDRSKTEFECYDNGGTAISNIDSKDINSAIVNEARSARVDYVYLGTTRSELAWLDGSPFTFTNWIEDEPRLDGPTFVECAGADVTNGVWIKYLECFFDDRLICQIEKSLN